MSSNNSVLYWRGIIGGDEVAQRHKSLFEKLVAGQYQAVDLDLKRLKGYRLYSVRINKSDRLLFTTVKINGQQYLLFLEEILNHDYQKSRFLKPGILKAYIEKQGEMLENLPVKEIQNLFEQADKVEGFEDHADQQVIEFRQAELYQGQTIVLSEEQQQVIHTPLPALATGAPGSGKSLVAMTMMHVLEERERESEQQPPIVYVAQSEHLVASMKKDWLILAGGSSEQVRFMSYRQLIIESEPDVQARLEQIEAEYDDEKERQQQREKLFIGYSYFEQWLQSYFKKAINKTDPLRTSDANALYQELRICSGYTEEEYMALGKRQCLFHDNKQQIRKLYAEYRNHLQEIVEIDESFHQLKSTPPCSCAIVDETQDFSRSQICQLLGMPPRREVLFLSDHRQGLKDTTSVTSFVKALVCERHIQLPGSFRCAPAIVEQAQRVIDLKNNLVGGVSEKSESKMVARYTEGSEGGHVSWLDSLNEKSLRDLRERAKNPDFAVICQKEEKEFLINKLGTALVFTPEEIKGLEYDSILVYKPLNKPIFEQANNKLQSQGEIVSKSYRAKKGQYNGEYGPDFNEIFTAFTRARKTLIILQRKRHGIENLVGFLQHGILESPQQEESVTSASTSTIDTLAWEAEVDRLLQAGKYEQAQRICIDTLRLQEGEVKQRLAKAGCPGQSIVSEYEENPEVTGNDEPKLSKSQRKRLKRKLERQRGKEPSSKKKEASGSPPSTSPFTTLFFGTSRNPGRATNHSAYAKSEIQQIDAFFDEEKYDDKDCKGFDFDIINSDKLANYFIEKLASNAKYYNKMNLSFWMRISRKFHAVNGMLFVLDNANLLDILIKKGAYSLPDIKSEFLLGRPPFTEEVILLMLRTQAGCNLLNLWVEKNPDFLKTFPFEILFNKDRITGIVFIQDIIAGDGSFGFLNQVIDNQEIEKKRLFYNFISHELLFGRICMNGEYFGSLLSKMLVSNEGLIFLNKLIDGKSKDEQSKNEFAKQCCMEAFRPDTLASIYNSNATASSRWLFKKRFYNMFAEFKERDLISDSDFRCMGKHGMIYNVYGSIWTVFLHFRVMDFFELLAKCNPTIFATLCYKTFHLGEGSVPFFL